MKLETWATEKPVLIRIMAQSLATAAIVSYEILTDIKNNEIPKQFDIPHHSDWLKMYRSHRKLQNLFLPSFLQLGGMPSIHAQIYCHIAKIPPIQSTEKVDAEETPLSPDDIYKIHIEGINDEIKNKPLAEEKVEIAKKIFINSEFLFLMKVVLPSWLLYQNNHIQIYRKARQGDLKSLDELLRLDKVQVRNPHINKWIYLYSLNKNPRDFDFLTEAIKNPPRQKITLPKVKYCLSGCISVLTELLGHRITAPEIQSLFDAVAVDYGYDDLRDTDLPDSPEAFSKAIQRERSFWQNALIPNRTKLS